MTGQVKEDIITRYFELGVVVKNGCIEIHPENIQSIEFIVPSDKFALPYLAFSYCSIPFIYIKDSKENSQKGYEIKYKNKHTTVSTNYQFSKEQSVEIFERNEDILKIEVHI